MTKYGIKYTDISYKEKKWYLKGVAENLKTLDNFNAEIEKLGKQGVLKQAYEKTLKPIYGDAITEADVVVEYK